MPKVGDKHFKYTKTGIAKAKTYAKKTGKKLKAQYEGVFSNIATLKSEIKRMKLEYEKAKKDSVFYSELHKLDEKIQEIHKLVDSSKNK